MPRRRITTTEEPPTEDLVEEVEQIKEERAAKGAALAEQTEDEWRRFVPEGAEAVLVRNRTDRLLIYDASRFHPEGHERAGKLAEKREYFIEPGPGHGLDPNDAPDPTLIPIDAWRQLVRKPHIFELLKTEKLGIKAA